MCEEFDPRKALTAAKNVARGIVKERFEAVGWLGYSGALLSRLLFFLELFLVACLPSKCLETQVACGLAENSDAYVRTTQRAAGRQNLVDLGRVLRQSRRPLW